MQSRFRSPREGFRSGPSATSGGRISSYGRDLDRGPPNQHPLPRKIDILMEAGRLAAEYLVSRGVIPPELIVRKFPNGSPPGFERQAREIPPLPEFRTSALARLGQRFDDEGRFDYRRREKSRKRPGPYSRVYDSDWSRENGKSRNWTDRGRGYSDLTEEDGEFPPEFIRIRRKGYVELKSSVSRVSADEQPTKSESASEKENYELVDDTWSKASSSSTKKDQQPEADEGSSKVVDEVRVSSSEITEEVKSEINDEPEKKESMEEYMDSKPCEEEGDVVMNDCKDLLKLCSFTKVPTRPRSSLANKSPKVYLDADAEMSDALDDAGESECKELNCDDVGSSEMQTPENHSHQSDKSLEEAADSQHELFESPLDSAICTESLNGNPDAGFDNDTDDVKTKGNPCLSLVPETIGDPESTLLDGKDTQDEEMVQEANGKSLDSTDFSPKAKRESVVMLEEEIRPETSASFKICDLNLTGSPELSEIPGGPSMDHVPSAPRTEMNNGVSADLSMSMRNAVNACNSSQISGPNKVIPVIDLEEDSHAEVHTFDSAKHNRGDISYQGLENVLNQATHTDDLSSIQDGYSLEFPEFLGTDMSDCPSAQGDLNDMQPGMGLHGAEGYPGVDDHIYVSLDELPIGFMGVWDQPSQDYGKFF
ncbi:uncharacterized protein At4g26450 isoform X1 [Dendrobium catenatum]|uniref:uncharacterized protein At4g26450 isoform X1 n=1 Tax=Dendrobium catenatum TaxID=906689 RepID=UPI0009F29825|nr:uncharacterized protein At4g26450 isoform X1 [Dendrobium catenatum]